MWPTRLPIELFTSPPYNFLSPPRYVNVVYHFILSIHRKNRIHQFSKAISELLREYIKPDYGFAFSLFASTNNDPDVKEMVTRGIRNWDSNRWIINQVRYLKAMADLIEQQQPNVLHIISDEDLDDDKDAILTNFMHNADAHYKGELHISLKYSNSYGNN